MMQLPGTEQLVAAGIIVMALSAAASVISIILFHISGRKLKEQLEKDYGNPQRYNR